jgi:hypothetical protein
MSGWAELVPRHPSESSPFGGWLQHVAQELGLAQRLAAAVPEHEVVGGNPRRAPTMRSDPRNRLWTEGNRSPRFPRLRRLELPLIHGFTHGERADLEIETSARRRVSTPAENLTDPPDENLTDRRGDEPQDVATS